MQTFVPYGSNIEAQFCDFCQLPASESHGGEMFFCEAHHARFVHLVRVAGLNHEDAWTLMDNEDECEHDDLDGVTLALQLGGA